VCIGFAEAAGRICHAERGKGFSEQTKAEDRGQKAEGIYPDALMPSNLKG
jgi:hypothetical protein